MHKLRVGILRGGPSLDYETSFISGSEILRALPSHYQPLDIVIDKEGNWYHQGVVITPGSLHKKVDVIFNALHGDFGEDGKVQQILESIKVPYTGSGVVPSAFAMNKEIAKNLFVQHGIKTPRYLVVKANDNVQEKVMSVFKSLSFPVIIKPLMGSFSRGIVIANNFHELENLLQQSYEIHKEVIIEEYIVGKEATCGVIERFRNSPLYTLIPTAIKKVKQFFTHEEKKSGEYSHSSHDLTFEEKQMIQELAQKAHQVLGLRHYSQSDFIVHPRRGVFLINVNTQPTLTPNCLFPKKLESVGSNLSEFVDHAIQLALKNR